LVVALRDREGKNVTSTKNDILTIACKALSEFRMPEEKDFDLIDPEEIVRTFCSLFDLPNGEMSREKAQQICNKVNVFGGAKMRVGDFATFNRGPSTGFYLLCEKYEKEVQFNGNRVEAFSFLG